MELAVYSTVHPGITPYLRHWYASLRAQTDTAVQVWIGVDEMTVEEASSAMNADPERMHWVRSSAGDTPAQVRERAWRELIPEVDAVILADADDVLLPGRVAHARAVITSCDLSACGLRLVTQEGESLGRVMPGAPAPHPDAFLPERNIFGLGNTVYRTSLLEQCLPLPLEVKLVDWYLATQAWLSGATLRVDATVLIEYRQHDGSTLPLLAPFSTADVRRATDVVRDHFRMVRLHIPGDARADRVAQLEQAARNVERFAALVADHPGRCEEYVAALNELDPEPSWWSCVAHPALHHLWKDHSMCL